MHKTKCVRKGKKLAPVVQCAKLGPVCESDPNLQATISGNFLVDRLLQTVGTVNFMRSEQTEEECHEQWVSCNPDKNWKENEIESEIKNPRTFANLPKKKLTGSGANGLEICETILKMTYLDMLQWKHEKALLSKQYKLWVVVAIEESPIFSKRSRSHKINQIFRFCPRNQNISDCSPTGEVSQGFFPAHFRDTMCDSHWNSSLCWWIKARSRNLVRCGGMIFLSPSAPGQHFVLYLSTLNLQKFDSLSRGLMLLAHPVPDFQIPLIEKQSEVMTSLLSGQWTLFQPCWLFWPGNIFFWWDLLTYISGYPPIGEVSTGDCSPRCGITTADGSYFSSVLAYGDPSAAEWSAR